MEKRMKEILEKAQKDKDVLAVVLFGSSARGEPHRDIDIAIVLSPALAKKQQSDKVLQYAYYSDHGYDVHLFQKLPLYVRKEILRDRKILLCKDESLLFDVFADVLRDWRTYAPHYEHYLEAVQDAA